MQNNSKILVMGVGNILLNDEGVGVHAIKYMENKKFPDYIVLLDGGTGGFHLLSLLHEYPIIILIDATIDGKPEGTLSVIKPRFPSDFPKAMSSHDIGLKDLVESAILLDKLPEIYLITVSVNNCQDMNMKLTPTIEKILPDIHVKVNEILEKI
ncbi:MAG: hydrogenase maturation protease [Bacteroidota bacterium]